MHAAACHYRFYAMAMLVLSSPSNANPHSDGESGACRDYRKKSSKCNEFKAAGQCNSAWGCDWTCGKCHLPSGWQSKKAGERYQKYLFDDYETVRYGNWWLSYAYAAGGYATIVVPTMCKRLERLRLLVTTVSQYGCVREVLISSRRPCVDLVQAALRGASTGNATLRVIDMGEWDSIYGPASRFLASRYATGNVLVHIDDDELPCEQQVCTLAARALKEPIGIYGHHKRQCDETGYYMRGNAKRLRNLARANYTVILTLFAATSRAFNDAFIRHFDQYATLLASTHGNGEDIAYSHFLRRFYGRLPSFVQKSQCGHWEVNGTDVWAASSAKLNDNVGMSAMRVHYKLRMKLCQQFWARLAWTTPLPKLGQKFARLVPLYRQDDGPPLADT